MYVPNFVMLPLPVLLPSPNQRWKREAEKIWNTGGCQMPHHVCGWLPIQFVGPDKHSLTKKAEKAAIQTAFYIVRGAVRHPERAAKRMKGLRYHYRKPKIVECPPRDRSKGGDTWAVTKPGTIEGEAHARHYGPNWREATGDTRPSPRPRAVGNATHAG